MSRKENSNPKVEKEKFWGEWIIASVLIGMISLPVSVYLIHFTSKTGLLLPDAITYLLVLFIVIFLSAIYIIMRKRPAVFLLKISIAAVAILLILVVAIISPLTLIKPSGEPTLWLIKLDFEPEYYVEITPEELEDLPTLQGLNNKSRYGRNTELKTTEDEKNRISDLVIQKQAELDYPFKVWIHSTPWEMDELQIESNPVYTELTDEDIEKFPTIKKSILQPDRLYGISIDEWNNFLEFTHGYDKNYLAVFVKYQDQFYSFWKTEEMRSYILVEGEYYEFSVGLVG